MKSTRSREEMDQVSVDDEDEVQERIRVGGKEYRMKKRYGSEVS